MYSVNCTRGTRVSTSQYLPIRKRIASEFVHTKRINIASRDDLSSYEHTVYRQEA